jgi:hypothetical protein
MKLACLLVLLSRLRPRWGGRKNHKQEKEREKAEGTNPAKRKNLSRIDGGGGCGVHDTALVAAGAAEEIDPAKKKKERCQRGDKQLSAHQRKQKAKALAK